MAGIWTFLQAIPLGSLLVPVIIVTLIAAFSTTADTMSTTIAALCTAGARHDENRLFGRRWSGAFPSAPLPASWLLFGGGAQGVDGVKFLAACGGFVVLAIFILQVLAAVKVFFFDNQTKKGYCRQC